MSTKIFFNGDIITMENQLYADSVLVKDNKIMKTGNKDDLLKLAGADVESIDLQGKTLMPSFIDAHSHFTGYASSLLQVNLTSAKSFDDIKKILIDYVKENGIKPGTFITANGYDHNFLKEKTHPTCSFLDQVLPDNPVVLVHQSNHLGVFNTQALHSLGIEDSKDGYLEEEPFTTNLQRIPMPKMEDLTRAIIKAQNIYAGYGITTMQEGMIVEALCDILQLIIHSNLLKLDLIGFVDIKHKDVILDKLNSCIKKYNNRFKVGGYKTLLDGSPQGKTAWMLEPYNGSDNGYKGSPYCKDEELIGEIEIAIKDDMQLLAHCNGDAASSQYIRCYDKAKHNIGTNNNIRPVIIHAQLLNKNQLDDVKRLEMIPSFFVAHVYHWGSIHIENFGMERAKEISLANSAYKKGITFTFHQDSPVIEPNMLETVWCAVNRVTKEGIVLGEEEKLPVLEALKAVTINSAYQYFEEDKKGSIKEGKLADLIILDKNPLKVNPTEIKDIKVLETLKEGETVFACP